jgi:glutathione S-transferase
MIVLYAFPISPFCDKIRRVLHVKRISYRTEPVSLLASRGWYRTVNPVGKVPAIEHDGKVIVDSTTIAHYLEEHFPAPALLPSDVKERALANMLEDWADESLYFYQKRLRFMVEANAVEWTPRFSAFDTAVGKALLRLVLPSRQAWVLRAQGVGRKPLGAVLEDLSRLVASVDAMAARSAWLVGDALSLADISIASQLTSVEATPEGRAILARFPAVLEWMHRVDALTTPVPATALPVSERANGKARPAAPLPNALDHEA